MTTPKPVLLRTALVAALCAALVGACASGPEVRTLSEPGLNLAAYSTYGYVPNPSTNRGGYRSFTTRYLEEAVDREMTARGLARSADHPQLLINFSNQVRERLEGFWGPGPGWGWGWGWGPGWGPGPWGPGPWGPGPWAYGPGWGDIESYSEGTLTIDVIDATSRNVIWSASAASRVGREALTHPQGTIDQAVAAIFTKFPRPAIGATH